MIKNPLAKTDSKQLKVVSLLAGMLFLPVFLDSSGIFNSTSFDARGIPSSILIALLFPFAVFMCKSATSFYVLTVLVICVLFPTATFGVFNSQYFSLTLVMSYILPLFVGFSACSLIKRIEPSATPERVLLAGVYVVGIVALFWVPYQVGNVLSLSRANGSVFDIFVIYQVWVYFPTVLAITFCASFLSSGPVMWVFRSVILIGIIFTGAREPFLFIFVVVGIVTLTQGRVKYFLMSFLLGLFFLAALYVIITIFPETAIALKFGGMLTGASGLDGGRIKVLEQFQFGEINPLLGIGFSDFGLFGSPHNQYIELYYRGGIFGLIISAILLLFWIRSYGFCSKLVWSIFGAVLLVTNVVNTPIRAPYTGAIIWTLFFFLVEARRSLPKQATSGQFTSGSLRPYYR